MRRASASIEFAHYNPQVVGDGSKESDHDTLKTGQTMSCHEDIFGDWFAVSNTILVRMGGIVEHIIPLCTIVIILRTICDISCTATYSNTSVSSFEISRLIL